MKRDDFFPSHYLKASDLQGKRVPLTVREVTREESGGETYPVVHFEKTEKILRLNKTNWSTLEELAGSEDSDAWGGTAIVLYPTKTDFQGKRVDAIRIDAPTGKAAKAAPQDDERLLSLEDIPF